MNRNKKFYNYTLKFLFFLFINYYFCHRMAVERMKFFIFLLEKEFYPVGHWRNINFMFLKWNFYTIQALLITFNNLSDMKPTKVITAHTYIQYYLQQKKL